MSTGLFDRPPLLLLLCAVGLAALSHINHLSTVTFGFFCAMLLWRLVALWRPLWLPNRLIVFVLLLMGIALIFAQQGIMGRDAGSSLLITALSLKLMEMKQDRDVYLIIYMAFVVAATQFLYEQNILLGAYIGLVCCLLLATLAAMNGLRKNILKAIKVAGLILLQAAPLAAAMFILFPRIEAPKWMVFRTETKNITGLSDVLEPGSITNLGLSDEVVFRAHFEGPVPPPQQRYWRGPVMSLTIGRLWKPSRNVEHYPGNKPTIEGRPYRYTLLMEPQEKNWVFGLDMPVGFSDPLSRNANYQLITSETPGQRAAYPLISYSAYNTGPISDAEYRDTTQLPGKPSARIKALVRRLHGHDAPPAHFIQNLLDHFHRENYRYTLEPPQLDANPIESFLFDTRAGFCSHYASAFVFLLRAAHIPARIITGYQGGVMNGLSRFIEVRQADAHAWAEVWMENRGWLRFDPTVAVAPERIEFPIDLSSLSPGEDIRFDLDTTETSAAFKFFQHARQLWGAADYQWQRWVIDYGARHQSSLLSELGIKDAIAMVYWLTAIIAVMTLVLSASLLRQQHRKNDPALVIYLRFCKKLANKGLVKGAGEGAKDFAERIKGSMPTRAEEIDRITDAFIRLRYGRHATQKELTRLKAWVASFRV